MNRPKYWPSNLKWDDSYIIIAELESYPPVYVLNTGTKIRGELPLSEYKRATFVPKKKSRRSKRSRKCRKSKRKSRKSKRKSRKSRKSKKRSKRC